MVCGPGGSGKTTFINTLCGRDVVSELSEKVQDPAEAHIDPELEIVPITEDLPDDHNGVLSLRLLDTPGFGDALDCRKMLDKISDYVNSTFDEVLAEESRIRRNRRFTDNRVHVMLYFIVPTGHGLRELDIEFMKMMGKRVNIIPVISKADSLTEEELAHNKRLVMEDIDYHNIPIYHFPSDSDSDSDSSTSNNQSLRSLLPFSIIGGTDLVHLNGKPTLARQYPWGAVACDDPRVSDFATIRDVLLITHLQDLKETTHDFLYETYRTEKLSRDIHSNPASAPGSPAPDQLPVPTKTAAAATNNATTANDNTSYVAREEQLRREEEKLKSIEMRVQDEISRKRQELIERERELRTLETRLRQEELEMGRSSSAASSVHTANGNGFEPSQSTDSLNNRPTSINDDI